ncbi:DUF2510 domain-containing protein [Arthrobacter sp. HMWF013]|uniref:DUF2510 domain-containing protein n=1 Tax=Arthrobacter sp. HMWF013 TaxID=2056849 RepID=UPI000D367795|nr:DUF2510 domain-containing protein [Arthrobacter sp. HMWF013]PTT70198.1 hypothetical protein DBR22_01900 [Arthrobacter sp. HMWF013]
MQTKTADGLVRLTDTAVIMEFGAQALPVKREASPRVIPYEHILEIDFEAPKVLKHGHLRLILREGQAAIAPAIDTYLTVLLNKKEAAALHEALQQRVSGVEYVAPPPSNEPDQVDREPTAAELGGVFKAAFTFPTTFQDLTLAGGELKKQAGGGLLPPKVWPIAECEAHVETGAAVSARVTATRVVAGAMLAGKAGAVVGAIAKKDRTKVYLNIITPDDVILKEVRGLDETKARKFATKVNNAAAEYKASPVGHQNAAALEVAAAARAVAAPGDVPPPPPPGNVPAGWYQRGDVQQYWDGNAWTDHTAPLAPQ